MVEKGMGAEKILEEGLVAGKRLVQKGDKVGLGKEKKYEDGEVRIEEQEIEIDSFK